MIAGGRVVRSRRMLERRRAVRADRRRQRRRVVLAVVMTIGAGWGAWALTRTSVFGLSEIEVVGNRTVARARIVEASGLQPGDNVMKIDLDAVALRVRALPALALARVKRDGSLKIRIEVLERAPVLEVRARSGRWVLDQTGQPLEAAGPHGRIPVLTLRRDPDGASPGSDPAVRSAMRAWAVLPRSVRSRIRAFEDREDGMVVFRMHGIRVVFGGVDRVGDKLNAIDLVVARAAERGAVLEQVDVRAPARPTARFK
ncbi:MAG: FtsQ-type POTRA domain-containing protein [Actinomycetota bacterium]